MYTIKINFVSHFNEYLDSTQLKADENFRNKNTVIKTSEMYSKD